MGAIVNKEIKIYHKHIIGCLLNLQTVGPSVKLLPFATCALCMTLKKQALLTISVVNKT